MNLGQFPRAVLTPQKKLPESSTALNYLKFDPL